MTGTGCNTHVEIDSQKYKTSNIGNTLIFEIIL